MSRALFVKTSPPDKAIQSPNPQINIPPTPLLFPSKARISKIHPFRVKHISASTFYRAENAFFHDLIFRPANALMSIQ